MGMREENLAKQDFHAEHENQKSLMEEEEADIERQ